MTARAGRAKARGRSTNFRPVMNHTCPTPFGTGERGD
jgi:hypothetical protein